MPLFQPTNISPSTLTGTGTIDATQDLKVTWQLNGTGGTAMTAYKIDIMLNDADSTALYSTGKVSASAYASDAMGNPVFYTATIANPSSHGITNSAANEYKLQITQWWNENDSVTQYSASVFIARSAPSVSILAPSPVTAYAYNFPASYSQAEGDGIEWAQWQIKDNDTGENIYDSGKIFTPGLLYLQYEGFLNGKQYAIRVFGETVNGVAFTSYWAVFDASYNVIPMAGKISACYRCDTDAVQLKLPYPLAAEGTRSGGQIGGVELQKRAYSETGSVIIPDAKGDAGSPTVYGISGFTASLTPQQYENVPGHQDGAFIPFESVSFAGSDGWSYSFNFPDIASVNNHTLTIDSDASSVSGNDLTITSEAARVVGTTLYTSLTPAYGFTIDLTNGLFEVTWGHIGSYAGETLPETWYSNPMPGYPGANPPFGAEVVYELAQPLQYHFTAEQPTMTAGSNTYTAYAVSGADNLPTVMTIEYMASVGNMLKLSSSSDTAEWVFTNTPLDVPFSFGMQCITPGTAGPQYGKLEITFGDGQKVSVKSYIYRVDITATDTYGMEQTIASAVLTDYEQRKTVFSVVMTPTQWIVVFRPGEARERAVPGTFLASNWQGNYSGGITGIKATGPLDFNYIWIYDGDFSLSQIQTALYGYPEYGEGTEFLANFEPDSGMNAGAIRAETGVTITDIVLYRYTASDSLAHTVATLGPADRTVRDYGAVNGKEYTYQIFVNGRQNNQWAGVAPSEASDPITPMSWNYDLLLCEAESDGAYHVRNEFRFALDVSSGTQTNNNKPALQANFTPYPLRQPSSQNYRTGTLTAYAGHIENGQYADSLNELEALRAVSTSPLTKFLKTRKGELLRVETSEAITYTVADKYAAQPVRAAIPWVEVGSSEDAQIITDPQDAYWTLG